jgi:hypothetical protein
MAENQIGQDQQRQRDDERQVASESGGQRQYGSSSGDPIPMEDRSFEGDKNLRAGTRSEDQTSGRDDRLVDTDGGSLAASAPVGGPDNSMSADEEVERQAPDNPRAAEAGSDRQG